MFVISLQDAGLLAESSPFPFSLSENFDFKRQFRLWVQTAKPGQSHPVLHADTQPFMRADFAHGPLQLPGEQPDVTLLHFPRLLSPEVKRRLLRIEAAHEMSRGFQASFFRQAWMMELAKLYDAADVPGRFAEFFLNFGEC